MSGEAVLNASRVAASSLAGQTQSRERHHADVRLELFSTSQSHCIKRSFYLKVAAGKAQAPATSAGSRRYFIPNNSIEMAEFFCFRPVNPPARPSEEPACAPIWAGRGVIAPTPIQRTSGHRARSRRTLRYPARRHVLIARKTGAQVKLYSRPGNDFTAASR